MVVLGETEKTNNVFSINFISLSRYDITVLLLFFFEILDLTAREAKNSNYINSFYQSVMLRKFAIIQDFHPN